MQVLEGLKAMKPQARPARQGKCRASGNGGRGSELQEGTDVRIATAVFLARLVQRSDPAHFKQDHQVRSESLVHAHGDLVVFRDQLIARDPDVAAGGFQHTLPVVDAELGRHDFVGGLDEIAIRIARIALDRKSVV